MNIHHWRFRHINFWVYYDNKVVCFVIFLKNHNHHHRQAIVIDHRIPLCCSPSSSSHVQLCMLYHRYNMLTWVLNVVFLFVLGRLQPTHFVHLLFLILPTWPAQSRNVRNLSITLITLVSVLNMWFCSLMFSILRNISSWVTYSGWRSKYNFFQSIWQTWPRHSTSEVR